MPYAPVVHHVLQPVELRGDGERGLVQVELRVGERDARPRQGVLEGLLLMLVVFWHWWCLVWEGRAATWDRGTHGPPGRMNANWHVNILRRTCLVAVVAGDADGLGLGGEPRGDEGREEEGAEDLFCWEVYVCMICVGVGWLVGAYKQTKGYEREGCAQAIFYFTNQKGPYLTRNARQGPHTNAPGRCGSGSGG